MNDLGEAIRRARKTAGFTQTALARELGVSQGAVRQWEAGDTRPTLERLGHLSKVLNIDTAKLLNGEIKESNNSSPTMEIVPISHKIPVVGMAAAAGYDPVFNQIYDLWECSDEEIPCVIDRDDIFAIRISGDSMEPALYDGDIIAVDPNALPSTGKLAVVNVLHEGLLIKRWYWRNGTVRLESLNPAGKTFEWPIAQVQTEGLIRWRWKVLALLYRAL